MGFSEHFVLWLQSYLSDRSYSVLFNGCQSNSFKVNSGIPQGSHLGPVLFILFLNDLPSVLKYSDCLIYADDVTIFKTISNTQDSQELQNDLNSFFDWCVRNCLFLNIDKCKTMSFTRKLSTNSCDYLFNGVLLSRVSEMNVLGVLFDQKLEFISHINSITSKANSILGWIKRESRQFSDPYVIKQLFITFVRPVLEYACQVWSPHYDCHKFRIEQVQKRFLRFALRGLGWENPYELPPYNNRLKLIDLPRLESRRSYLSFVFIVKLINGNIDSLHLLSRINFNVPQRTFRNLTEIIQISNYRTNYERFSPLNKMFNLFNKLNNTNINLFDQNLNFSSKFKTTFFSII